MKTIDNVQNADEFFEFIKVNKITYKKLKNVVFGNTAIKVIKLIRANKADLIEIKPMYSLWWDVKRAINEVANKQQ